MTDDTPAGKVPDANKALLERIDGLIQEIDGLTERKASFAAFGHGSAIKNIRQGLTASPKLDFFLKLAPVLNTTPGYLAFGQEELPHPSTLTFVGRTIEFGIPVAGRVAAGQWLEVDSTIDYPLHDPLPLPFDPRWPQEAQYALLVTGKSINRIADDGDFLACVNALFVRHKPVDGELVIVERRQAGGHLMERTAKLFRRNGDVVELWPDSDDPAWKDAPPIVIDPSGEQDESTTVEVVAFVTWVHSLLPSGRSRSWK